MLRVHTIEQSFHKCTDMPLPWSPIIRIQRHSQSSHTLPCTTSTTSKWERLANLLPLLSAMIICDRIYDVPRDIPEKLLLKGPLRSFRCQKVLHCSSGTKEGTGTSRTRARLVTPHESLRVPTYTTSKPHTLSRTSWCSEIVKFATSTTSTT